MKLIIRAAGSIKRGPERDLINDYLKRANNLAKATGLNGIMEQEVDVRSCRNRTESTEKLFKCSADPRSIIVLDENGKNLSSRQFSQGIQSHIQDQRSEIYFVIGEADGFDPEKIPSGVTKWSLGKQTWPHKLVRVMICEQVYRSLSIINNTPYHRD